MHRQILGLEYGDPREGDHINRKETLNNTDENLRIVDSFSQQKNKGLYRSSTSGLKGVTFHKATKKWLAQIAVDGERKHLGLFATKELAYAAYCRAARKFHGEFACVA
jgi:hypothetical protein